MISRFTGKYRFLSNFYPSTIMLDGKSYPTIEHAYQAAKTNNVVQKEVIRLAPTPGQAKKLGRNVDLIDEWEQIKIDIMSQLLSQKFTNLELKIKLLDTMGHELIEGNSWGDKFWGVCNGEGENHLGKCLMQIRDIIDGQEKTQKS